MVFNHKEKSMPQLLDKVKYLSLWWLKHKAGNVSLEFDGWWQRPFVACQSRIAALTKGAVALVVLRT